MTNAEAFAEWFPVTLKLEGVDLEKGDTGYVNHPADDGKETNYGITLAVWRRYLATRRLPSNRPIRAMTFEDAAWVYEHWYWQEVGAHVAVAAGRPLLAGLAFDWGVNAGPGRGRRFLQYAVGAAPDGQIGPKTRAALATAPELPACERFLEMRGHFHRARVGDEASRVRLVIEGLPRPRVDVGDAVFLKGWLARCRVLARRVGVPIHEVYSKPTTGG